MLKTFHNHGGEPQWESERSAMVFLRRIDGVIGFHGCYTHGLTSNIILEYADGGTLDQFFATVPPPSTPEDRYQFWFALASLVGTLADLREITFHDATKYQGWVNFH